MFETLHSFQGAQRENAGREPKKQKCPKSALGCNFSQYIVFSYPSTDRGCRKGCFKLSTFTTDPHIYRRLFSGIEDNRLPNLSFVAYNFPKAPLNPTPHRTTEGG